VKLRRLTAGEAALAREVFGDGLDPGRPWVLIGAPTGGWAMVVVGLMLFPVEVADFAAEPLHRQAWFVHELAHVRQFQTKPLWTLLSWARVALTGGYLTRRAYAPPTQGATPNLEQEAMAVEAGFLEGRAELMETE
jgi:hypothetical protein